MYKHIKNRDAFEKLETPFIDNFANIAFKEQRWVKINIGHHTWPTVADVYKRQAICNMIKQSKWK